MIKVMVLFYGLVMFVPTGSGLTVLFVNAEPDGRHIPRIEWLRTNGNLEGTPLPQGFDCSITGPEGDLNLAAQDLFLQLEELDSQTKWGLVREDCLNDESSCKDDDDEIDLVLGKVKLHRAWATRPATYCNGGWSHPVEFDDFTRSELRKTRNGPARDRGRATMRLPTALRVDATLTRNELETLISSCSVNGQDLVVNDREICKRWIGEDADPCVVLALGNPSELGLAAAAGDWKRLRSTCGSGGCRLDRHFGTFYRLTVEPPRPNERWLPYVYGDPTCPPGYPLPNHPAVRCPPAFGTLNSPDPSVNTEPPPETQSAQNR